MPNRHNVTTLQLTYQLSKLYFYQKVFSDKIVLGTHEGSPNEYHTYNICFHVEVTEIFIWRTHDLQAKKITSHWPSHVDVLASGPMLFVYGPSQAKKLSQHI